MYLHGNSRINNEGHLEIGGCDTVDLVKNYGTPLYIYDEALIESKCREFHEALRETGMKYQVAYASKAFLCVEQARLIEREGLCLDVVSGGELYTALQAGYPADKIHFHGNNKTIEEIEEALNAKIGCFVVDNFFELEILQALAEQRNEEVSILLRVTPGVEAHTHEYVMTGQEDSKFGFDIMSGQANEAVEVSLKSTNLKLLGVHSHIGSQIFEPDGFVHAINVLMSFLNGLKNDLGFTAEILNVGGGFGIRYTSEDEPLAVAKHIEKITNIIKQQCEELDYKLPELWLEPGRSIVGEAGTTLYTIGSTKTLPSIRKYVSVDGGMTDNIRPALYGSKYEAMLANRANDENKEVVSIAGKCCESGDMLIWDCNLPVVQNNDLLAVSCTGAYGYSMANNYNRIRRPAVVFVKDGVSREVVRRETYEDLVRNDRVYIENSSR
ncbi:diaminopimelate decarboxylase [Gottfriedia acidiceleris]|uniref:Diaminopimelate decarboxylase n=1 Tax=Gottfriedia acidiceleris TaxID=371036 RepID=A0ABY4JL33_9BACI|nr:diaminopimelate decarboxylase [Gottfriedia acidiceleris]UPM54555.1 diaminopimelate decarboxylase [Gottfriedia acidiceleris]